MKTPIFLGDEATATAFRLAGLRVRVVATGDEAAAFALARGEAALLLLDADYAARLPTATLRAALESGQPPLLVLPAAAGEPPAGDPAATVRRLLGLAE